MSALDAYRENVAPAAAPPDLDALGPRDLALHRRVLQRVVAQPGIPRAVLAHRMAISAADLDLAVACLQAAGLIASDRTCSGLRGRPVTSYRPAAATESHDEA